MNITVAKQADIRANMKKYFDLAYEGETIMSHGRKTAISSFSPKRNINAWIKHDVTQSISPCWKKATRN